MWFTSKEGSECHTKIFTNYASQIAVKRQSITGPVASVIIENNTGQGVVFLRGGSQFKNTKLFLHNEKVFHGFHLSVTLAFFSASLCMTQSRTFLQMVSANGAASGEFNTYGDSVAFAKLLMNFGRSIN